MDTYRKKQEINCGRQLEVDLAKVLAIIFMVCIHVAEKFYMDIDIQPGWESILAFGLSFAGDPLAAPVFMSAMGIGLVYGRPKIPGLLAKRGLSLIGLGYLLNFFRASLVSLGAMLLFQEPALLNDAIAYFLMVDILQFAGVTFIFFALVQHFRLKDWQLAAVTVVLLIIGALLPPFLRILPCSQEFSAIFSIRKTKLPSFRSSAGYPTPLPDIFLPDT